MKSLFEHCRSQPNVERKQKALKLLASYEKTMAKLDYEIRLMQQNVNSNVSEHDSERLGVNAKMLAILIKRRALLMSLLEDENDGE